MKIWGFRKSGGIARASQGRRASLIYHRPVKAGQAFPLKDGRGGCREGSVAGLVADKRREHAVVDNYFYRAVQDVCDLLQPCQGWRDGALVRS